MTGLRPSKDLTPNQVHGQAIWKTEGGKTPERSPGLFTAQERAHVQTPPRGRQITSPRNECYCTYSWEVRSSAIVCTYTTFSEEIHKSWIILLLYDKLSGLRHEHEAWACAWYSYSQENRKGGGLRDWRGSSSVFASNLFIWSHLMSGKVHPQRGGDTCEQHHNLFPLDGSTACPKQIITILLVLISQSHHHFLWQRWSKFIFLLSFDGNMPDILVFGYSKAQMQKHRIILLSYDTILRSSFLSFFSLSPWSDMHNTHRR